MIGNKETLNGHFSIIEMFSGPCPRVIIAKFNRPPRRKNLNPSGKTLNFLKKAPVETRALMTHAVLNPFITTLKTNVHVLYKGSLWHLRIKALLFLAPLS